MSLKDLRRILFRRDAVYVKIRGGLRFLAWFFGGPVFRGSSTQSPWTRLSLQAWFWMLNSWIE